MYFREQRQRQVRRQQVRRTHRNTHANLRLPIVTVGTPPQEQVVILDTGSSDLYFDSSTAATCQQTGLYSCRGGTFDHADSSTYKIVAESPAFNTSFGDGSTATGPFAEDVVGIGDVRIDGVQFGVADEVDSTTGYAVGLMGLGYSENEASRRQYPNIPEVLASSGEINSRLYSIYLNDIGEWKDLPLLKTTQFAQPVPLTHSTRRNIRHRPLWRHRQIQIHIPPNNHQLAPLPHLRLRPPIHHNRHLPLRHSKQWRRKHNLFRRLRLNSCLRQRRRRPPRPPRHRLVSLVSPNPILRTRHPPLVPLRRLPRHL